MVLTILMKDLTKPKSRCPFSLGTQSEGSENICFQLYPRYWQKYSPLLQAGGFLGAVSQVTLSFQKELAFLVTYPFCYLGASMHATLMLPISLTSPSAKRLRIFPFKGSMSLNRVYPDNLLILRPTNWDFNYTLKILSQQYLDWCLNNKETEWQGTSSVYYHTYHKLLLVNN